MTMTPEAKRELSATIRALRERLLQDLHAATESAYRLSVSERESGLPQAERTRRRRLESWVREQERAEAGRDRGRRSREDLRREAEKQAAYTLLNRLVLLRLLEAAELRTPAVVTGGWEARGYKDFRALAPALTGDETEGYAFLLRLVFEDLAAELPGLYGPAGVADLIPVPAATLRYVVEALDSPALGSCWTDDMTLGWVYQYWNDPEREALDAKLSSGGKLAPHEIASKTQMFTERYMVEWLLHNSLGPMWLAMCKKHGWAPEVEADGTLARLEERRADWRAKRDASEVSLTELMPLHTDAERRWAYFVPQPIPEDAVTHAPETVRDLKVLDPAVGSGHFLVVLFDLLLALYREEARHRSEEGQPKWSTRAAVERILEHNLHGIDLDPRAVQIAAAALWLKAKQTCPEAEPGRLNLVASNLRLGSLPDEDPALMELRQQVEEETGIPGELTDVVMHALRGADHLGSLLKVDAAVDEAITRHEEGFGRRSAPVQQDFFLPQAPAQQLLPLDRDAARASVLGRLEGFLTRHTGGDDLGLRLRGEQLASGVRFVRLVREGSYDLVVGNPPYQGTPKLEDAGYIVSHYPKAKADLCSAFIERGLQLVLNARPCALLSMRNWLFIKNYEKIRRDVFSQHHLQSIGDFAVGAFDEVPNDILSVAATIIRRQCSPQLPSIGHQPTKISEPAYDRERTQRKRAATLALEGLFQFSVDDYKPVELWPLVYWWPHSLLNRYVRTPKLGENAIVTAGAQASPRDRFLHFHWEFAKFAVLSCSDHSQLPPSDERRWVPYIGGGEGRKWIEPLVDVINWCRNGLTLKVWHEWRTGSVTKRVAGQDVYFQRGVSATAMGHRFQARYQRYLGVPSEGNPAVYRSDPVRTACNMNASLPAYILQCFNPGTAFEVGDVKRLPLFPINDVQRIWAILEKAFVVHEWGREASIEYRRPGPSPWRQAQEWAQAAVDRPDAAALPSYEPEYDPEPPADYLSYALGVVLGRFGPSGEGILNPAKDDLSHALPAGILFLDGTLEANDLRDGLGHDAARPLHAAWAEYGRRIDEGGDIRGYLRTKFFEDVHRKMYESRPIHWPLSSEKKTFVAWVTIHRWAEDTLRVLLADHLQPALRRLEGELDDLRAAKEGGDRRAAREAERRYAKVQKWREELAAFIASVEQCAEKGPPPTDASCPPREADVRYPPDLDDGVMINASAIWPLLLPQWKEPKKWWKELACAQGKKDYDWSHLAMRYWPARVDKKCQADPSLGVAHGCFWKYHPGRAWAWELRLQDEIGPTFRIEEAPYRDDAGHEAHRADWLRDHPAVALAAAEREAIRRLRKRKKPLAELRLLEPGLWAAVPEACWSLELKLSEKQGSEFRLLAPDEAEARAAFEKAHPEIVAARKRLLANLTPPPGLFADEEEDGANDEEGDGPDDSEEAFDGEEVSA
jgi:hypothetical protein